MTDVSQAASMMGRRSVEARIQKWGKREFSRKLREWGKLGGRPKGKGRPRKKKGRAREGSNVGGRVLKKEV
jgi:hypothetical protein